MALDLTGKSDDYRMSNVRARLGAAATAVMLADSITRPIVEAYCAGVNARIQELTPRSLPFEYKLLDYAPEPWSPLKCSLILKYMAFDLSSRSDDLRMSNALAKYGPAVVKDLFPDYPVL